MRNKQLHRFCMNIPDYIWRQIMDLDNEMATTTTTGTILTILEKGLNYYKKKKRASLQETPSEMPLDSTIDLTYNKTLGIRYASPRDKEEIERNYKLAKIKWADGEEE